MFLSACVLCAVALMLLVFFYTNKLVKLVATYFLIIALNLIVGTLYLSRVSLYSAVNVLDYQLYTWLLRMHIPLFQSCDCLMPPFHAIYLQRLYLLAI